MKQMSDDTVCVLGCMGMATLVALVVLIVFSCFGCTVSYRQGGFNMALFSSSANFEKTYDATGLTRVNGESATGIPWDTNKAITQTMSEDGQKVTDEMAMQVSEKSGEQTKALIQAIIDAAVKAAAAGAVAK